MGVLNVTPDSFFDGGRYLDYEAAVRRGLEMVAEGADVVDVGGESTRPGAGAVTVREELRRVLPVVEALAGEVRVSIDTTKTEVADAALTAGATLVNDVSSSLAEVAAEHGAGFVAMHRKGTPTDMQRDPHYDDVVREVREFLVQQAAIARAAGVGEIYLDPGIGFGKTVEHNLELLQRLGEIAAIGRPVVIGTSRKTFLGKITGRDGTGDRIAATIATNVLAYERGARVFRVHDVAHVHDALLMTAATVSARWSPTTTPTSSTK
jgi:dihydropteroate synthase